MEIISRKKRNRKLFYFHLYVVSKFARFRCCFAVFFVCNITIWMLNAYRDPTNHFELSKAIKRHRLSQEGKQYFHYDVQSIYIDICTFNVLYVDNTIKLFMITSREVLNWFTLIPSLSHVPCRHIFISEYSL